MNRHSKSRFGRLFVDQIGGVNKKTSNKFRFKDRQSDWQDLLIPGGADDINETEPAGPYRIVVFPIAVILVLGLFFSRIFHLQIIEGKQNRDLADSNRIQIKVIHAPRGVIYDRNGKILAQNEPGFRLVDKNSTISASQKTAYINRDDALKMEVAKDPRYKNLEVDSIRTYPMSEKGVHVLGYVSEITEDELKDPKYENYKLGDKIGRGGVEQTYEKVLKGSDGGEVVEVDAQGNKVRTLRKVDAIPGQNLYLTIDSGLQEVSYQKLAEGVKKGNSCCGALVAEDPFTGQILALVSYPSFDPKNISEALTSPNSPILNRAISGIYPPGSTFKIASALAGLESGKITESTIYEDTGVLELGPFKFANWYFTEYGRKEEGGVDLVKALKRSNDIYFYRLGQTVGETDLGLVSKKLGLGAKKGIDIPGESAGLIPDGAWKEKNIGDVWYPGDTLHMAIGQGFVLSTPLQINALTSFIAASGKEYPPHLALKITSPHGVLIKEYKYDPQLTNQFKPEHIDLIKKGLSEVTINGGTAWPFFSFPIQTAGKTGTAEFGDPKNKTHAWYTTYAPLDNPNIVMTALVEAGGEGSSIASPITKEVYRWYFSSDKNNLIKDLGGIASESAVRTLGE